MARSKITGATKSLIDDDGAALISVARGEQPHIDIEISWLVNLTGYNVNARLVEGVNDQSGTKPTDVKVGGQVRGLTQTNGYIRNVNDGDNKFVMVIPWDIAANLSPQPTPENPVYMFIDLEVGEPGSGDATTPFGDASTPDLQVWKPLRGLVEILYSPTEV
jgi:hypothetical protein